MVKLQELLPFDYDQVRLVPGQCVVKSRSEVNVGVKFGPRNFKLPTIPANMSTIIDKRLASWLASEDYFYVMHRFDIDPVQFAKAMHDKNLFASVSVGVQEQDYLNVGNFKNLETPIEYATIDIAHGDAESVLSMIDHIKHNSPDTFVIAGNVATPEAVWRLENAGADAIKVGIGPGAACTSSPNTGFGTRDWQLSAVEWCSEAAKHAMVVADGGIRNYGDIAKSIAFGADMVMIGGMFAAHEESPGKLIKDIDGNYFKEFFGSASEHQKGESKHVEGKKMLLPYKGLLAKTLRTIEENLQSSVSYAGGKTLLSLRDSNYVLLR